VANIFWDTNLFIYLLEGSTSFGGVVKGIRGLNDFRMKPRPHAWRAQPHNTSAQGNALAPDDFATIYDVTPLYKAGIDGTGQKIAIAGQIEVNLSDIEQFRSQFNLPANDPQTVLVPGAGNPGNDPSSGDLAESDLDLEWAGAVAREPVPSWMALISL